MKRIKLYHWQDNLGNWHKTRNLDKIQDDNIVIVDAKLANYYVPSGMKIDKFVDKLQSTPPVSSVTVNVK